MAPYGESLEDVLAAGRSAWLADSSGWRTGPSLLNAAARYRLPALGGAMVVIRTATAPQALEGAVAVERAGGVPVLWPGRAGMPEYLASLPYLDHDKRMMAGRPASRYPSSAALVGVSSGGTTGAGKVVLLQVARAMANAQAVAESVARSSARCRVASLRSPAFSAGLVCDLLASLVAGDQVAAIPVSSVLLGTRAILRHRPDAVHGTPTVVAEVCGKLPPMRRIVLSGEPLPAGLLRRIRSAQPAADIMNGYGLSEAGPRVTVGPAEVYPEGVSCGPPIRDVSVRLDAGTREIVVATPYHAVAVLDDRGLVSQVSQVRTGDTGILSSRGVLIISGRRDRLVVLQGSAYSTETIESALQDTCPGVRVTVSSEGARLVVTIPMGRDEATPGIQPALHARLRARWPMLSRVSWQYDPRPASPAGTITEAGKVRRGPGPGTASLRPASTPD